jgi:hypothetical protein
LAAVINLTLAKEKEGHGWGKEYLLKWMTGNFPEIRCAKDEKRQRILKTLEQEEIIRPVYRGRAGMYATHWTLGRVARLAVGMESGEGPNPAAAPQDSPQPPLTTSRVYSSLFEPNPLCSSGVV